MTRIASMVVMAILFALPLVMFSSHGGGRGVLPILVIAAAAMQVLITALKLFDKDLTALAWDDDELRVETLLSSHRLAWRDVFAIEIEERRAGGAFDLWEKRKLVISASNDGAIRKLRLPMSTLDCDGEALAELMAAFENRHSRSLAKQLARSLEPAAFAAEPDPAHGFELAPRAGRFGRKSIAMRAPEPLPATFGRADNDGFAPALSPPPEREAPREASFDDGQPKAPSGTIRVVRGGITGYEVHKQASVLFTVILCGVMALVWIRSLLPVVLIVGWFARHHILRLFGKDAPGDPAAPFAAPLSPSRPVPGMPAFTQASSSHGAFDPDAIMARYLAGRAQSVAPTPAAPAEPAVRQAFGRKIA